MPGECEDLTGEGEARSFDPAQRAGRVGERKRQRKKDGRPRPLGAAELRALVILRLATWAEWHGNPRWHVPNRSNPELHRSSTVIAFCRGLPRPKPYYGRHWAGEANAVVFRRTLVVLRRRGFVEPLMTRSIRPNETHVYASGPAIVDGELDEHITYCYRSKRYRWWPAPELTAAGTEYADALIAAAKLAGRNPLEGVRLPP